MQNTIAMINARERPASAALPKIKFVPIATPSMSTALMLNAVARFGWVTN